MKQTRTTMKRPEAEPYSAATVQQLKKLVAGGEGISLEFKRKANHPEKIVRELVAFANTQGGTLLVGVSDEGALSGIKFPDEDAFAIRRALKRYCRPYLKYTERLIPIATNKYILAYEIPSSARKPHFMVHHRFRREALIRVADKSMKASREMQEIVRLRQQNHDMHFMYGEHEQKLLHYLNQHPSISLSEFIKLTELSSASASRILVTLVVSNILRITPNEKGDRFSLLPVGTRV